MKWLKRLSLTVLALVLVVLGLAALILNTQWGARFVLERLDGLGPGTLETRSITGTLAGPLEIEDLSYRLESGLSVRADRVRLDVVLPALFGRSVIVEELHVRQLDVTVPGGDRAAPAGEEPPVELPAIRLPVTVDVRSLRIDGASLTLPGSGPLRLESLQLSGGLADGVLALERLELATPQGSLSLEGRVNTAAGYETELEAEADWLREGAEFSGTLALSGDLDDLSVSLVSRPPVDARLEGRVTGLPAKPAFDLTLDLEAVATGAVGLGSVPGPLSGRLEATGDLSRIDLSGWLAAAGERVEIERIAARRGDGRLVLETVALQGRKGARLDARGTVALGGENPVVDLRADWSSVNVPLPGGRVVSSPAGRLRVEGTPSDYRAEVSAGVAGALPAGQWRISGTGGREAFQVEALRAETLEGVLTASGRVAWTPAVAWNLNVEGNGINPKALAPAWPGSLAFRFGSEGRLTPDGPSAGVRLERLSGQLRGRDVKGSGRVQLEGFESARGELELSSGESRVSARGRYGPETDLALTLAVEDAGDWYPGAAGHLNGEFRLTGSPGRLRVAGGVAGGELVVEDLRAESLTVRVDAGQDPAADGRLALNARGLDLGRVAVAEVSLEAAGSLRQHQVSLGAASDLRRLDLRAAGGWDGNAWQGRVAELSFDGARIGRWRLDAPVALQGGAGGAELGELCLAAETGRACVHGRWSPERGLAAGAAVDRLPLALLELALRPVTDRPLTLDGRLDLDADVRLPAGGTPAVEARFETADAAISLPGAEGVANLRLVPLAGDLRLAERALEASAELGVDEAGSVSLNLASARLDFTDPAAAPVRGRLDVNLTNLRPLAPLMAPLADPAGRLAGTLEVSGTLGEPALGGELALSAFRAEVPRAGLTLENGSFTLAAENGGLDVRGRVESGAGALDVDGRARFGLPGGTRAEATLRGEDFLVMDRPGLEAVISPDLALELEGRRLDVSGSVRVPELRVDAGKLPGGGGVAPSPDVVVVGRDTAPAEPPVAVHADVAVTLGESVSIQGYGFDGSASGNLRVIEQPGRATLGRGKIGVTGRYRAYGQDLTIRRGRLLFSDTPVDNPALDITAVRNVDEVTAGVRVGGTARRPDLNLFSEPPLGSEAEILSYLVLGRPLERASSGDGNLLANAAASIGTKGGNLLAKQIGTQFGIDEIAVEQSDEIGGSALTLGEYLSPRLYVSYGVGLVESVSLIRLRYELTDHWSLEAASGREASASIRFNIER